MVLDQGYLGPTRKFSEEERGDFAEPQLSGLAERDGHVSKHKPHGLLERHFNVSVGSDGQSHKTMSTNHNLFEEKGEPKRYRTEVLVLTSLTPYR